MHAIGLTVVDWLIIAVYFGFVLGIVSILGIIDIGGVNEVFNRVPEAFYKPWSTSGDPTQNGMMVFVKWITPNGAFWGLIAGMGSSFTMFLAVKFSWIDPRFITMSPIQSDMAANFWRAWWAWLICFGVTIVISLFMKKKPAEELVGRDHGRRRRGVLFQEQVRDGRIVGESSCRI
jgi:hypothetical protein